MTTVKGCIALIAAIICTVTSAESAPVPPLKGGTCWANIGMKAALDPSTQFSCELIGRVTVAQIYEKGFKVTSMAYNPVQPVYVTLIIEEQR